MIPRVHQQGKRTAGLLHYLYGPGTHEEHIDPHLVASFDGTAPDPGRDPAATRIELKKLLDQPLHLLAEDQRPEQHVWHCSVRAAPGDRTLTDAEWGEIARRTVAATGIDTGDGAGCRWAALRHADDHIHIVATLVREDGHRPDHHRSGKRAQAECRLIEADYDLTPVQPGDGTAARRATSPERHKAQRQGRERPVREELREGVRRAAAGAGDEAEFFTRLAEAGFRIRTKQGTSGDTLGYAVALPGDRNKADQPVWFSGSKLAPDLSLRRIQQRFAQEPGQNSPSTEETTPRMRPAAARRMAGDAAWNTLRGFETVEDRAAAAQISATGEVLDALATTSAASHRTELRSAAAAFERASRSHTRAAHQHSQELRRAARALAHSGPAFGRGEDGGATAMALSTLVFLTLAAARWHAQRQQAQQAAAVQQAAQHLRDAYRVTATPVLRALHDHGKQLPHTVHEQLREAVRAALPHLADTVLSEPGWPALAATLTEAEHAGHSPSSVLPEVANQRELHSADSTSDVLVWRIRQTTDLPAAPARPNTKPGLPAAAAAVQPEQRHAHSRRR
ncbi:relaxase/mobilization nuclease domain-containing protein [Streptomyces oceani]|uniref:Mobilization protein n=1 Tax=Streptomyces oceani TaxID=1075402 RepID=A0A1E7JW36_9ACTN|nr:relaxase/mobilization nuclease domain-containing protein [Streptomyces oceani]OEU95736.1 mobilization protein [Streptomyces oceani]